MRHLTPAKKMQRARARLAVRYPHYGYLSCEMTLKEDPTCDTAWTDGRTIAYNPDFVDGLSKEAAEFVYAHEVEHIRRYHHTRRGTRDPRKWNIAGDTIINSILYYEYPEFRQVFDAELAPRGCVPATRDALRQTTESIYRELPDSEDEDGGGIGEVRDLPGDGDEPANAEQRALEEDRINTADVMSAAFGGDDKSSAEKRIAERQKTREDWRSILRDFIERGMGDAVHTWRRPSRRHMQSGTYLPGTEYEARSFVGVVDISGSIDRKAYGRFWSELVDAIRSTRCPSCLVVWHDTDICETRTYSADDVPDVPPEIRQNTGGTMFAPVLEYLAELDEPVSAVVWLTDLGAWDDYAEPIFPVLWATYNTYGLSARFGREIRLDR